MNISLTGAVWIHLGASILLTGSLSVLVLAGRPASPFMRRWEAGVLAAARWLVLGALASGLVWLALRASQFEGRPQAAWDPQSILRAMVDTWPGAVWLLRHALLAILAALLWFKAEPASRADWLAARAEPLALAALALLLAGASGHSAAVAPKFAAADMVHLLAAGLWVGGLPPLALLLRGSIRRGPEAQAVRAMQRFSHLALAMVLLLAATGTVMAWLLIGDVPGLLGTAHGQLLLGKLAALVPALLLAAFSRRLLPALAGPAAMRPADAARRMALFIAAEALLVLLLAGMAAAMTVVTPARHAEPAWPLPVRLALDMPEGGEWLAIPAAGLALLAAALSVIRRRRLLAGTMAILALGSTVPLAPSIVEAFPTSFLRSQVPYRASSIAQGERLFLAHCTSCHAEGIRTPAPRSAGELFWLVTQGREGMPGFGQELDDTQRWHLVNHLRAARHSGQPVGPDWPVAPDFSISMGPLRSGALQDLRGRRMVLLVLYDLPGSRQRMAELARRYGLLSVLGVEVVAVPRVGSEEAVAALGADPPAMFPVVTAGNEDIHAAYRLLAPGAAHAEFLIDRQGYVRAVWADGGLPDSAALQAQTERLNAEKAPPPLPDDHIH